MYKHLAILITVRINCYSLPTSTATSNYFR